MLRESDDVLKKQKVKKGKAHWKRQLSFGLTVERTRS